ncbi:MAG: YIP1 family protein [Dehalococcoidia bacterium]|nr:YIP1 family protein [Dehalococcoidia bacterium]
MAASTSLFNRMLRASQLAPGLYEEVEADTSATGQAVVAVVLVSIATGVGSGIDALSGGGAADFTWGLMFGLGTAIAGWLLWAFFAYVLGVSILKGPHTSSTWGELLRTMGFANSPGLLRVFAFMPVAGGVITVIAYVWMLIATVVAIRQALDFSTGRAIVTAIVGWLAYMFLIFGLAALLGSAPILV